MLKPIATEYKPMFTSFKCVPLTAPDLKEALEGTHIILIPAPAIGVIGTNAEAG